MAVRGDVGGSGEVLGSGEGCRGRRRRGEWWAVEGGGWVTGHASWTGESANSLVQIAMKQDWLSYSAPKIRRLDHL